MAKVIKFGKVNAYKKIPDCPFVWDDRSTVCKSFGIQLNHPASKVAAAIAKTIVDHGPKLRLRPREYVIIDSFSLVAQMPLYNERVIITEVDRLVDALNRVEKQAISRDISCFNLIIYYTNKYDSLLLQIEDLHDDLHDY